MSDQDHTAQAYCADQARTHDFTAYAASLFVSPEPRRAWLALAAFNADVAHIRDHISQPMPGEIRLQWWRDTLTGTGEGEQGNPVAAELLRFVKRYDLPVDTLVRLIDAHVFDVYDDPMPDMAALEAHCRDTSAATYALRAKILGDASPEILRIAEHAGIAEGLDLRQFRHARQSVKSPVTHRQEFSRAAHTSPLTYRGNALPAPPCRASGRRRRRTHAHRSGEPACRPEGRIASRTSAVPPQRDCPARPRPYPSAYRATIAGGFLPALAG